MSLWGDLPTWIAAVGTVGALIWAIFLYSRSLRDAERAQARLLAPIGEVAPIQVLPGASVETDSAGTAGLLGIGVGMRPVVVSESYKATIRLVSTSNEAFSDLQAALLLEDGRAVDFPLGFAEVAPHETRQFTYYYPPGEIAGNMRVRLRFRDANGRHWERINGAPVQPYSGSMTSRFQKVLAVVAIGVVAVLGFGGVFTPPEWRPWLVAIYAIVAVGFGAVKAALTIFEYDSAPGAGGKLRTAIAVCDVYAFVFAVPATVLGALTLVPAIQQHLAA